MMKKKNLSLNGFTLPIGERTCIMGVLNITPDSFSDGGRYFKIEDAVSRSREMADEGVDIIDIGGESSRPGARAVSASEELSRVIPVIKALRGTVKLPLSIDTYKAEVARAALMEGVSIVNDITALGGDTDMARTIAEFDAGVILMHMKGKPFDMDAHAFYENVIEEISAYLSKAIDLAVRAGIDPDKIIVDPGIGFGKTMEHNITILRNLNQFEKLGKPLLVGTSRKSFIGKITGKPPDDRIFGTAATFSASIINGADIIRVHDVSQMREVAMVMDAISR